MAECERISSCDYFNDTLKDLPATANLFKRRFCQGGREQCARQEVMSYIHDQGNVISTELELKITKAMPNIAPNDHHKVRRLLRSH